MRVDYARGPPTTEPTEQAIREGKGVWRALRQHLTERESEENGPFAAFLRHARQCALCTDAALAVAAAIRRGANKKQHTRERRKQRKNSTSVWILFHAPTKRIAVNY